METKAYKTIDKTVIKYIMKGEDVFIREQSATEGAGRRRACGNMPPPGKWFPCPAQGIGRQAEGEGLLGRGRLPCTIHLEPS